MHTTAAQWHEEGMDWFSIPNVDAKLKLIDEAISCALATTQSVRRFDLGRDIEIRPPQEHPAKPGLASRPGQARLFHDLASIELQAMELAVRTLFEFPEAPSEFRLELAEIARSEATHLALCLRSLRDLGIEWGDWPAHIALWNTVGPEDRLLDRILIVHRYLEGSGLDAGESILRRLVGVATDPGVKAAVRLIVEEEIGHVQFGSLWYRRIAEMEKIDPERDFTERIGRIALMAPRRERLAWELRLRAGFNERELEALERVRA